MGETDSDQSGDATLHDVVEQLEEGDEFKVYGGEYIVDEVIECEARPMVRVRKKSVGGWMQRTYRLEWEDPTDEDDETLVIKTKYKSHWDVYSTFQPEDIELEDEPAEIVAGSEESEPVLVTDGGGDETVRLESIEGVTWTDDDGTTYRRVLNDGKITDIEVTA